MFRNRIIAKRITNPKGVVTKYNQNASWGEKRHLNVKCTVFSQEWKGVKVFQTETAKARGSEKARKEETSSMG